MSHVHGVDDGVGYGVLGESDSWIGAKGQSNSFYGVLGRSQSSTGVLGLSDSDYGVHGSSRDGFGVVGSSGNSAGLYGESINDYAAVLDGKVKITGNLEKARGSFKIDHPLDPANKYLQHSFVESTDMKNVYDGVVVLDRKGKAEIGLPDWFGALNKDFRYQLTAIGAPGPNLYIAEEISEATTTKYSNSRSSNNDKSRFKIAGGASGMKVSW
jgi:hypothetical protein